MTSRSNSLLQEKLTKLEHSFIIGIAGDSGSGKTTFSDGIRKILGSDLILTITMDGYHTQNRETRAKTGKLPLDPEINNFALLRKQLTDLKNNKPVDIPQYNHQTGDFDPPQPTQPAKIILVEGLHALYPEFLDLLDLNIFVDPCREVKWEWKFARDVAKRGHRAERLEKEMLAREAAYKRWIDFQKINADIVIKIFHSRMKEFARYDFINPLPNNFYKVELIMRPAKKQLPDIRLPFNLSSMVNSSSPPFLLATTSCRYWGQDVIDVHMDGAFGKDTIDSLEAHIESLTNIDIDHNAVAGAGSHHEEKIPAPDLAQLIIAWRFLEQINEKIGR